MLYTFLIKFLTGFSTIFTDIIKYKMEEDGELGENIEKTHTQVTAFVGQKIVDLNRVRTKKTDDQDPLDIDREMELAIKTLEDDH